MTMAAKDTGRNCEGRNQTWKGRGRVEGKAVGIEGLVVWGGTLAIAGLMAVFTASMRREKRGIACDGSGTVASDEAEVKYIIERKKDARLVVECKCSSIPAEGCNDRCCCIKGGLKKEAAYVDSCASTETSRPVCKKDLTSMKHGEEDSQIQMQEILLLSDNSQPGSTASGDDYCFADEFRLPTDGKAGVESYSDEEEDSSSHEEEYNTDEAEGNTEEAGDSEEDSDFEAECPSESSDQSNTDNRRANIIRQRYINGRNGKMLGKEMLFEDSLLLAAHVPKSGNWVFIAGISVLLLLPLLLSILPDTLFNSFYVM